MTLWYISFASKQGFLGATVVEGISAAGALHEAKSRGLHPGGQAMVLVVQPEDEQEPDLLALRNRLVGEAEMQEMGGARFGDIPQSVQHAIDHASEKFCPHCNKLVTH